jgi:hypothetical protein
MNYGYGDIQMSFPNLSLKKITTGYDAVASNETVSSSETRNYYGWNSLTAYNLTINGTSNLTARNEINISSEFHASAGNEVHIFPSNAFMDCDTISDFARIAQSYSSNETESLKKDIEINFSKNKSPSISIIPNPNSGLFTIEISNSENVNAVISIKSLFGNELKKFNATEQNIFLDLHDLSKGIYFVEVLIADNKFVKKLIIQ